MTRSLTAPQITGDVDRLAALAAAVSTAPPLSVALLGDWGSGKSSFMLQMQSRITQLAALSRNNLGRSAFAASVRQVRFNAWHYSDEQVWTGLVEELFRALAEPDQPDPADRPDPQAAAAAASGHLQDVQRDMEAREGDLQRLTERMARLAAARGGAGWLTGLGSPARMVLTPVVALQQLARDLRASWQVALIWLLVGAAATLAYWRWGSSQLHALAVTMLGLVGPAASLLASLRRAHKRVGGLAGRLDGELQRRRDQLSSQIADLQAERARLDAATRLAGTLRSLAEPSRYERYRGLVGQVHEDLVHLQNDLQAAREQWELWNTSLTAGPPPLERIVLYIDDLDRCPPRRVVDVLAAVNLLLALPLFVVVVAVDARWLLRSLAHHQRTLFDIGDNAGGRGNHGGVGGPVPAEQAAATPVDYLDKIFQVPFALRPLGDRAGPYLAALLPAAPPAEPANAPDPDSPAIPTPLTGSIPDLPPPADGGGAPPPAEPAGGGPPAQPASPPSSTAPAATPQPDSRDRTDSRDRSRAAVAQVIPDLQPASLQLSNQERDFLLRMGPLIPTPRAGKKLVNLYRLVRIGIPDDQLPSFIGDPTCAGTHQPVLLLLAVLVGRPDDIGPLFTALRSGPPDRGLIPFLRHPTSPGHIDNAGSDGTGGEGGGAGGSGNGSGTAGSSFVELADLLDTIRRDLPVLDTLSDYQRWLPEISRFSFHTLTA